MTPEQIRTEAIKAAEELQGTTKDLTEIVPDESLRNDADFCNALDEQVLLCERCGWWDEVALFDDDEQICGDCVQEQERDA